VVFYPPRFSKVDIKLIHHARLPKIKAWVEARNKDIIIPFCAGLEAKV